MLAGNERERVIEIGAKFIGGAGLAGVVAGDGEAAAEFVTRVLETADVVALPAVQRNGDGLQPLERAFGVDAQRGIAFFRQRKGAFHKVVFFGHFLKSLSENVGQASSLPVHGASSPRVSGGRMPPELADKMSALHSQTGSEPARGGNNGWRTPLACGFRCRVRVWLRRRRRHFAERLAARAAVQRARARSREIEFANRDARHHATRARRLAGLRRYGQRSALFDRAPGSR